MTINKLNAIARNLELLQAEQKKTEKAIEELKAVLIAEMEEQNTNIMELKNYIVSLMDVSRTTLDTKKIKAEFPEVYEEYSKTTAYKQFKLKAL